MGRPRRLILGGSFVEKALKGHRRSPGGDGLFCGFYASSVIHTPEKVPPPVVPPAYSINDFTTHHLEVGPTDLHSFVYIINAGIRRTVPLIS